MDVNECSMRIRELMEERGWSEYRLIKESGLSQSIIKNIIRQNKLPTMPTLEALCEAFDITMAEFFCAGKLTVITAEQKELFDKWDKLDDTKKRAVFELLDAIEKSDKYV